MRLIDADKLLKFFTVDTANQTYRFGTVKKQIESALTVQAIPLDKIKQEREKQHNKGTQALYNEKYLYAVKVLDKLIEESE